MLYCFLKYLRQCQFFQEIVIFQKSDPFFVIFQTAITLLILTLHWKAMLFWKCLYPYFNIKWLFDVATEVKILLWYTYLKGYWEERRSDWLMLVTVCDDTWNVFNMQHTIPNSKKWNYSDIPVVAIKRLKNPPTWLKVVTTLEKPPPATHFYWIRQARLWRMETCDQLRS